MHGTVEKKEAPREASWFPGLKAALVDLSYFKGRIRVSGFGRYYPDEEKDVDWSFRELRTPSDASKNIPSINYLPEIAESLGISEVCAPSPVFGRDVCYKKDLPTKIRVQRKKKDLWVYRGKKADICVLYPGESYAVTVAGCTVPWVINLADDRKMFTGHAGLKCVVDFDRVIKRQLPSQPSLIDKMWRMLGCREADLKHVRAGYAFPIDPRRYLHRWDDPEHPHNEDLCHGLVEAFGEGSVMNWKDPELRKLGAIDLGFIIRTQWKRLGIPSEHIYGASAPDTFGYDGEPLWYDTRGPHGKAPRNLVILTYCG